MTQIGLNRIITGSSIEGWKIQHYQGPVSANIVAGTGMFGDFAAGLSDIFGGHSTAYQRQLDSIKSEALAQIARAASSQGANWIIGLKLDFDEISGKGKQMLMVSAVGTAVTATSQDRAEDSVTERIQSRQLESYMIRAGLLARLQAGDLVDSARVRQDLVEHVVVEGLPWRFQQQASVQQASALESTVNAYSELIDELIRKLETTEVGSASPRLYECLAAAKPQATDLIIDAIVRNSMTSFPFLLEGLNSTNGAFQMVVLQTIKGRPRFYSQADIPILRQIQQFCETGFPQLTTSIERKGLLGKKILTHCPCGCDFDQSEGSGYCPACDRDGGGEEGRAPAPRTPAHAAGARLAQTGQHPRPRAGGDQRDPRSGPTRSVHPLDLPEEVRPRLRARLRDAERVGRMTSVTLLDVGDVTALCYSLLQ